MKIPADFDAFRALSAQLGQNPLRVQGPGGNTSLKDGGAMWIKASGTELAHAEEMDIFVAVDRAAAQAEARDESGDGSCKATVLDASCTLRPSIETTFHAAIDWPVVAHTHSIATLAHATSPEGLEAVRDILSDLPVVCVPYAKPGLPLTREILARVDSRTQVIILANHGLVVCGADAHATSEIMENVEARLDLPVRNIATIPTIDPPEGFDWADESWIVHDEVALRLVTAGSYYPDHVVFLGPALPRSDHDGNPPAIVIEGAGVALRHGATPSQRAMLRCLSDFLARLPKDWIPTPIGAQAEAELLNWDAEKYRQALAARA